MPTATLIYGEDFIQTPLYDPTDPAFSWIQYPFVVKIRKDKLLTPSDRHKKLPVFIASGKAGDMNARYCAVDGNDVYNLTIRLSLGSSTMMSYDPFGNSSTGAVTGYNDRHRSCFPRPDSAIPMFGGVPVLDVAVIGGLARYSVYYETVPATLPATNADQIFPAYTLRASTTSATSTVPDPSTYLQMSLLMREIPTSYLLVHTNPQYDDFWMHLAYMEEWVRVFPSGTVFNYSTNLISTGAVQTTYATLTDAKPLLQTPTLCSIVRVLTTRVSGATTLPDVMIVASQMGGYLLKSTRTRVDIVGWVPAAGSYQILKDGATYGSPAFTFKYSDYADPVFVPEYIQSVSVSTLTTQLTPILANKADAAKLPGELVKFQDFVNKSNYDADSKSFLSTLSSLLQAMSDAVVKTDGLDLVPRGNVTMAIMISIVATGIISWLIFKGTGWQR